MDRHEIDEPLKRLRAEIKKLGDEDKAVKQRMKRLVADLEGKLRGEEADEEPQLIDSLRRNIERFEVEHPRLAGVLNQLMAGLSNMGI